jgi:small subunit ribosomal protein S20
MIKYILLINSQEVKGMPNVRSAMKRVRSTKRKTLRNNIRRSVLKTTLKKSREAIANKDSNAQEAFRNAVKVIDRSVAKNILHKNTAARMKSKLAKALNASK